MNTPSALSREASLTGIVLIGIIPFGIIPIGIVLFGIRYLNFCFL